MRYFLFAVLMFPMWACSDFIVTTEEGQFLVGRTMDDAQLFHTEVRVQPRGERLATNPHQKQAPMVWTSSYGYVGMVAYPDLVIDGLNERGLSVGVLRLPETEYPALNPESLKPVLSFVDLPRWILGNFATVEEVKRAIQGIQIATFEMVMFSGIPKFHLALHDAEGASLVIEYLNGQLCLFENKVGVVTNGPGFPWHLTNLQNYVNLTVMNIKPHHIGSLMVQPTGQGSGLLGLPGDWTPPSRFVRLALVKTMLPLAHNAAAGIRQVGHLLNMVDVPYGAVYNSQGIPSDYTQWVVIKDLTQRHFYYRTYNGLGLQKLDLNAQSLQKGAKPQSMQVSLQELAP